MRGSCATLTFHSCPIRWDKEESHSQSGRPTIGKEVGASLGSPGVDEPQKQPLSDHVFNVPNTITLSRIVATPYLAWLVTSEQYEYAFYGTVICAVL